MIYLFIFLQTNCLAYLNLTEVDLSLKELPLIIENKVELDRTKIRVYSDILGSSWLNLVDENILEKNSHPYAKYNLALRNIEKNNYEKALQLLEGVYSFSPIYQESLKLKGFIQNKINHHSAAIKTLELCEVFSLNQYRDVKHKNYHQIISDECRIEKARVYFKIGEYQNALSNYEQISFNSSLWPSIILEKAWVHHKLKNYSKSNGILLALNSPLLKNNYHFEVQYLKALNYYKLCLYDDAYNVLKQKNDVKPLHFSKNFFNIQTSGAQHIINLISELKTVNQDGHLNSIINELEHRLKMIELSYIKTIQENDEFFKNHVLNLELSLIQAKRKFYYNPKKLSYKEMGIASVNESLETWDFDQEFWIDEIQNYEQKVKNQCQEKLYADTTHHNHTIASTGKH